MPQSEMMRMNYDDPFDGALSAPAVGAPNPTLVRPRFFKGEQKDYLASQEKGFTVWREVELVELIVPGDKKQKPVKKVTRRVIERFPKEYHAWKHGEQRDVGIPLEEARFLSKGHVRTLKELDIVSVEDLAAISDAIVGDLGMDYREKRDQAKTFLADYKDMQRQARLEKENEELHARLANLEEHAGIADVERQLNAPHVEAGTLPEPPQAAGAESTPKIKRTRKKKADPAGKADIQPDAMSQVFGATNEA